MAEICHKQPHYWGGMADVAVEVISAKRKAGGREVQLPVHRGRGARGLSPPGPAAPRRPIAKFNAKVMRERARLRAAMQERPATRPAVTLSAHTTKPLSASRNRLRLVVLSRTQKPRLPPTPITACGVRV